MPAIRRTVSSIQPRKPSQSTATRSKKRIRQKSKPSQDLKDVLDSEDTEEVKAKTEALMQVAMKLGEAMYQAEQAAQAEGGDGGDAGGDEAEVVDADFEEVDDDKDKS